MKRSYKHVDGAKLVKMVYKDVVPGDMIEFVSYHDASALAFIKKTRSFYAQLVLWIDPTTRTVGRLLMQSNSLSVIKGIQTAVRDNPAWYVDMS